MIFVVQCNQVIVTPFVPHARARTIQQLILFACLTQGSQPDLAFASKGHDAHVVH